MSEGEEKRKRAASVGVACIDARLGLAPKVSDRGGLASRVIN